MYSRIWPRNSDNEEHEPAAQSQYVECVYIGGNKMAITGIAIQGRNCTTAYGRRSSKNLQEKDETIKLTEKPAKKRDKYSCTLFTFYLSH